MTGSSIFQVGCERVRLRHKLILGLGFIDRLSKKNGCDSSTHNLQPKPSYSLSFFQKWEKAVHSFGLRSSAFLLNVLHVET